MYFILYTLHSVQLAREKDKALRVELQAAEEAKDAACSAAAAAARKEASAQMAGLRGAAAEAEASAAAADKRVAAAQKVAEDAMDELAKVTLLKVELEQTIERLTPQNG